MCFVWILAFLFLDAFSTVCEHGQPEGCEEPLITRFIKGCSESICTAVDLRADAEGLKGTRESVENKKQVRAKLKVITGLAFSGIRKLRYLDEFNWRLSVCDLDMLQYSALFGHTLKLTPQEDEAGFNARVLEVQKDVEILCKERSYQVIVKCASRLKRPAELSAASEGTILFLVPEFWPYRTYFLNEYVQQLCAWQDVLSMRVWTGALSRSVGPKRNLEDWRILFRETEAVAKQVHIEKAHVDMVFYLFLSYPQACGLALSELMLVKARLHIKVAALLPGEISQELVHCRGQAPSIYQGVTGVINIMASVLHNEGEAYVQKAQKSLIQRFIVASVDSLLKKFATNDEEVTRKLGKILECIQESSCSDITKLKCIDRLDVQMFRRRNALKSFLEEVSIEKLSSSVESDRDKNLVRMGEELERLCVQKHYDIEVVSANKSNCLSDFIKNISLHTVLIVAPVSEGRHQNFFVHYDWQVEFWKSALERGNVWGSNALLGELRMQESLSPGEGIDPFEGIDSFVIGFCETWKKMPVFLTQMRPQEKARAGFIEVVLYLCTYNPKLYEAVDFKGTVSTVLNNI